MQEAFFANLPPFEGFHEVVEPARYTDVPETWCVAITDVAGSTAAIEAGRYKDVNALGVASIVAVLNAAADLDLPYVFGGDGATLLFPASRLDAVTQALRGVRQVARERFDMELRIGVVPVRLLVQAGHPVRAARFRPSPHICLAMLAGSGLSEAERWIKDREQGLRWSVAQEGELGSARFDGFECRWEPIVSRNGRIIALLVQATDAALPDRTETYRQVLGALETILGDTALVNPANPVNLHIAADSHAFDTEARLRGGKAGVPFALHHLQARAMASIGRMLLRTGWRLPGFDGSAYRDETVLNTDFRKFDEMLRMVIDVRPDQHLALQEALALARTERGLAYGLHDSDTAVMTCLVFSHEGRHVHFVDGADGGYAMAARPMKAQLKSRG